MAEVVISSLLNRVLENLKKVVLQEFGIGWGLNKELKKLKSTLTAIQAVLQDAEGQQMQSEELRDWLWKLKDAAYDADDIIDEFATKALQQRVDVGSNAVRVVRNFFSLSNPCLFSLKMGQKIKCIGERFDMIAAERSKFHLREGAGDRQHETAGQRLPTYSLVNESEIYGRVQEKEKIVDLMLTDARDKMLNVSIIPLVGMGGLGKTTLAQLAFNDESVVKHFKLRMWVCVSEDFDIIRLIKAILESATKEASGLTELDPLQRRLQEILHDKRYLLVLDDVWNEDEDKWVRLRDILGCGGKGSTIIVTTRIEKVALIMGTFPIQNMSYLPEEECWSLFKHRAFGDGREENEKLTAIGKAIVKKCGGVPLAAKTLGGLLRFTTKESEWLSIKDREIWDLRDQKPDDIIPILRLSYKHLPSHLKRCFTYFCLFPKDFKIDRDEVILQWMANGFILSTEGKDPEDIGDECFNELLWRSFFQDVQKDGDGNIKCKMHDLVHDLARSVAEDEYAVMETYKEENVSRRTRHISCNFFESVNESQALHTVLQKDSLTKWDWEDSLTNWDLKGLGILLRFSCLRVFDLSFRGINELPPSISNLIHLRYLNLGGNPIKKLPESICTLKNLQTLKLFRTLLSNLLEGLENMCSLRHLDLFGVPLKEMPKRIGKLTHLRALDVFIVGQKSGQRIGELKDLNKLRGELQIHNLELVRNKAEAEEANLISKQNLCTLILSWMQCDTSIHINKEEVFEGLQPHPNIKRLDICGFDGTRLPTWIHDDSKFSNLVKMSLDSCKNCEYLPSLGLLPSLEKFEILYMDALKFIGRDFYGDDSNVKGFPSLKELKFWNMPNLEKWLGVDGTDIFPHLKNLTIYKCPKLSTLPYFPSLEHLTLQDCSSAVLMFVGNLTSLSFLHLESIGDLEFLQEGMLSRLTLLNSLVIKDCLRLRAVSEELDNLIALETMTFLNCEALESLPRRLQSLSSLRSINISNCPKMDLPTYLHHLSEDYLGISNASTMEQYFKMSFSSIVSSKIVGVKINMSELRESSLLR